MADKPRTPKNADEARRLLERADASSESGKAQIAVVLEWAEGRTGLPQELRSAMAQARSSVSSAEMREFWRKPVDQLKWLWDKNVDAGNAIMRAVGRAAAIDDNAAPMGYGDEQRLLDEAWPYMDDGERAEAQRRFSWYQPPQSRQQPDELSTRQRVEAARWDASANARRPGVSDQTVDLNRRSSARSGPTGGGFDQELYEQYVADGMPPELAAQLAGQAEVAEDPLIGVPEGHVAERAPAEGLTRGQSADAARYSAQAEAAGTPPGSAQYRESHTQKPFGWNAARIGRLQDALVAAGLLRGEFRRGYYDAATGQAYAESLALANSKGANVIVTLDDLAQARQEQKAEAIASFVPPQTSLAPDPASLRSRARGMLLSMRGRASEIDDAEIDELAAVLSGEFRRQRQMEAEIARRQHVAEVETQFGDPTAPPAQADLSGIEEVDPMARFDEFFSKRYGGEINTREASEEVDRRSAQFSAGLNSMRGQVRSGGA